jgi:PleD family two-component response regulator
MPENAIWIIDPFENVLQVFRMILEEEGFAVFTTTDLDKAPHGFSLKNNSIIITDFFFPPEKMFHFIRSVKKEIPESYLIMSTSVLIDDSTYKELFEAGLDDWLVKPFGREKLLAHIEKGIKRQEKFIENKENQKENSLFPPAPEDYLGVFGPAYFKKLIRQEIKKAKRHQQPVSLILLKLPSKEKMGPRFGAFYHELIDLLRKSLREEDLIGRENGNLGILLDKTDEAGSQNLGRRLSALIQTHPSFQSNQVLQDVVNQLAFQYYTFPHRTNIPEFLITLFKELEIEFPSP